MAQMSKELFEKVFSDVNCNVLLHPWDKSCVPSNLVIYKDSLVGSAKFYSVVYLIQIILRGKKMKRKQEWIKMANYYVRSTLFGHLVTVVSCNIGCILRKLMGNKITYNTFMLIPFTLTGLFIYLEPASRRGLVVNLFVNLYIEYWLRSFEKAGYLSMTKTKQTLLFMLGSAVLFYLMRLEGDKESRTPLFWLFTPEKVRRKEDGSNNVCPHNGLCHKFILKGAVKYLGIGLGISLARAIVPRIRSPVKAIASIRGQHLKLGLFFGSYIGIYRAVVCYLCRKRSVDSSLYALPAGCLAGLSFVFSPGLGIAIGAMTGAMKLYSTILYEKKLLPANVPLPEILYCICQGTLFHARVVHPDVCPKYIFNLLSSVSSGRIEMVYDIYQEILDKAIK